jgi:hypothetical protein
VPRATSGNAPKDDGRARPRKPRAKKSSLPGPEIKLTADRLIVRVARAGDRVLFLPSSGLEVELEGEDLVLLRERDVQAVSSKPSTERSPGQYL